MPRRILNYSTLILIIAALFIGGYFYWLHQKLYPSTDDAYIQAHVVTIAPQINGSVQQVFVKNQEHVSAHQLLFTIDATPFDIALANAKADLQNTQQEILSLQNTVKATQATLSQNQAQLIDTQKTYDRTMALVKKGYMSKSSADDMTSQLTVAKQAVIAAQDQLAESKSKLGKAGNGDAQLKAAKTAVSQAELNLQYTKIYAPASGKLAQFTLQSGQTVTAYQSLFSLVENDTWWAEANMKETDLQRVHPGQSAMIYLDMYPSHPFIGKVESIAAGSGESFSLLPPENATGNWVKVTQRFPVRIKITHTHSKFPLRIGASCTVVINTTT